MAKKVRKPRTSLAVKAVAAMNTALRAVYDECAKLAASADASAILSNYRIGQQVRRVLSDQNVYGVRAVEQLATAMGVSPATLYGYKRLVDRWPSEAYIKELVKRRSVTGQAIAYSYLERLSAARISDKDREVLVERFFSQGMSFDELRQQVSAIPGKKGNTVGRSPRNPMMATQSLRKLTQKWLDKQDQLYPVLFDAVNNNPAKYHDDEDLLQELRDALADQVMLRETADQNARRIQVAIDTLIRENEVQEERAAEAAAQTPARPITTGAKKNKKLKKARLRQDAGSLSKIEKALADDENEQAVETAAPRRSAAEILAAARGARQVGHENGKKKLRSVSND